jgi:hypothetical protein
VAFFRDWINLDETGSAPAAMHMPAFSSPDRIIAAVVQTYRYLYARRTRTPLDMVAVHATPYRDGKHVAPVSGCFLGGVSLENACFDTQLVECPPGMHRSTAPVLWLQPAPLLAAHLQSVELRGALVSDVVDTREYRCPLYRSSSRAQSLVTVEMGTGEYAVEHWVKRGVALVCCVLDEAG